MVTRKYTYKGLSLLQESLGVDNYTVDSDDGLVYTPNDSGDSTETYTGTAYHTHHAFEGPDVLWNGVKCNLTHSSSEATPTYQNVISLYGLNDGHAAELIGEKLYTSIDATPTTVNLFFNLLTSACGSAFYKEDATASAGTVKVNLPMRYDGNFEDAYITKSWLEGWSKRAPVTVTGTGSSASDVQVGYTLTYDGDMQVDFDDVRFADTDGVTTLGHYIVYKTDSTSAYLNVNIPYSPKTGETKTIYLYYGNAGASSGSDGFATYNYFDDFADGKYTGRSSPYNNWVKEYGTLAIETATPISGAYSINHTGNGSDTTVNRVIRGIDYLPYRTNFDFQLKTQGTKTRTPYVYLWFLRKTSLAYILLDTWYDSGTNKQKLRLSKYESSTWTPLQQMDWMTGKLPTGTKYAFNIFDSGSGVIVKVNGVEKLNTAYTTSQGVGYHGFGANLDTTGIWDNIAIGCSKNNAVPTASTPGTEVSSTTNTVTPSTVGVDYLVFTTPSDWGEGDYWTMTIKEYGSSERTTRAVPLHAKNNMRLGYDAVDKYNTLRLGVETQTTGVDYTVSLNDVEYSYEV